MLIKIISDGGLLMGPFLIIVIAWIVSTVRYVLNKNRRLKSLIALLLFPLAFGLLSVSHWFLYTHALFKQMELSGNPDVMQFIQDGLVMTRSGIAIAVVGGISLIVSGLAFLLPSREDLSAE